jgi:predicted phosphodiesterase
LERRKLQEIPVVDQSFDVLVSAGDTWEGQPERAVQSIVDVAQGKRAIMVAGNYDFYSCTISDVIRRMHTEADRQNAQAHREIVTILSADSPVCKIKQTRFIGLTLWTDWAQAGRWMPDPAKAKANAIVWTARARGWAVPLETGPREYRAIKTERGLWTPYDAVAEHAREKAILLDALVSDHEGPTVVVTHHPPLAEIADAYHNAEFPWWTPAFYASDILPIIPGYIQPKLWICGHVHAPFDRRRGRTRVVCNPVEGENFNPNLIIKV